MAKRFELFEEAPPGGTQRAMDVLGMLGDEEGDSRLFLGESENPPPPQIESALFWVGREVVGSVGRRIEPRGRICFSPAVIVFTGCHQ